MAKLFTESTSMTLLAGQTLLDHLRTLQLAIPASCNGAGKCHECVVQVRDGAASLSSRTNHEAHLPPDYRLACQAVVTGADEDITLSLPRRGRIQILQQGDATAATDLASAIQRRDGQLLVDGQPVGTAPQHLLGLAIDVGTTTVALRLFDLESGEPLAGTAFENPQRFAGSDVMSRLSYALRCGQEELQHCLIGYLNEVVAELTERPEDICEITLTGNAIMRDLAFGLDVTGLGQLPFKSITQLELEAGQRVSTAITCPASNLGLRAHPAGRVYGLPLIGCHVGADTAACLLALDVNQLPGPTMLIDIGTNTEVVLIAGQQVLAASCPAGPSFEGSGVGCGMPALEGAIESVQITEHGLVLTNVIGSGPPVGLCGSGLVDLLAELLRTEVMNGAGRFAGEVGSHYRLDGITLSEEDVSHLAQAKAANYAGQAILLQQAGLTVADLAQVCLAGGFANYIRVEHAAAIGMIPAAEAGRTRKIGNASLTGACRALLSVPQRRSLEAYVRSIRHVELETDPAFFDIYVDGCRFGPLG